MIQVSHPERTRLMAIGLVFVHLNGLVKFIAYSKISPIINTYITRMRTHVTSKILLGIKEIEHLICVYAIAGCYCTPNSPYQFFPSSIFDQAALRLSAAVNASCPLMTSERWRPLRRYSIYHFYEHAIRFCFSQILILLNSSITIRRSIF